MSGKKIGFRESVRLMVRGYKMINGFNTHVLLSLMAKSVFSAICPFINIYLSALIINELVGARDVSRLTMLVWTAIGANLACMVIKSLLTRWAESKGRFYQFQCSFALNRKIGSMDYVDTQDPELLSQIQLANMHQGHMGYGLRWLLLHGIDNLVIYLTQIAASVALTVGMFFTLTTKADFLWLNAWWMDLLMVCLIGAPVLVSALIGGRISRLYADASENNNQLNRIVNFFLGPFAEYALQRDVRLYRQEKLVKIRNLDFGFTELNRKCGLMEAGGAAFNALSNGAVFLFAACKALGGAFGVGSVVQYVSAVTQFISGINGMISLATQWNTNMPYLKKYLDLLDIPNKKYMGSLSVEQRDDNEYEIEFHNVSFKYPGSDSWALRNLDLKFNIGERMAVVGENGSGKSTMVSLLTRLYEPTEGVITLNDIDIKKYNYDQYMAIFGVVFQDFALFPFTLGENVAASIHYDEARVTECLQKAGFADKLAAWKEGLHTYLYKNFTEEGVVVSGGEAQKIALARALYKDAPFIVLDEPTAALDPVSEYEIYSKFNDIVEDKTAIYISHRLSSCRFCRDIVVFDHGRLVQRGSHEELLSKAGKYQELWNAQAQYYQE